MKSDHVITKNELSIEEKARKYDEILYIKEDSERRKREIGGIMFFLVIMVAWIVFFSGWLK